MPNDKKPQYLLDTSLLVTRPRLLSRSDARDLFLIPLVAIEQLTNRGHGTSLGPLQRVLAAAAESGVEVVDRPKTFPLPLPSAHSRLDTYDLAILKTFQELRSDPTRDVILVTQDVHLRKAATELGLPAIFFDQLQEALQSTPPSAEGAAKSEVQEEVAEYERYERSNIQKWILFAVIGGLAAVVLRLKHAQLFAFLASKPAALIVIAALLAGVALYAFRQRFRASYGAIEAMIGVWIVANALPLTAALDVSVGLQVIGGLYVVVRGLDNVGNGLKETRYGPSWQKMFG